MSERRFAASEAPKFLAAKFQKLQFLIDGEEMASFLSFCAPLRLFANMGPGPKNQSERYSEEIVAACGRYCAALADRALPEERHWRAASTLLLTRDDESVAFVDVFPDSAGNERELVQPLLPSVQMQPHSFTISHDDKILPLVFGPAAVSWGVQLSYPQIFQDPSTRATHNGLDPKQFVNASLFSAMRNWMREHTVPVVFLKGEKRITSTIRLGKRSLSWAHNHPTLSHFGLQIARSGEA